MTSLANFDIQKHNDDTKQSIKNLDKPLSSFNYYIKEMRENWHNLSEDEKDKYMRKSKRDNQRYAGEKQEILDKSKEEIKKLNIFLLQTTGRVPCVGLDNGFKNYTVIGPVDTVELFTDLEKKNFEAQGIKVPKYKSVDGKKFNWRAARKWSVQVYGGSQNCTESWWGLRENYEGEAGNFTTYTNYKGESWTENY
tara:strand:+ start:56 stop:640 length:585 start_codon:yes stop_codon:yes gene_type:complete